MFGLGKHIRGGKFRTGVFIRNDHDFAGTCDHINGTCSVNQFLGSSYISISGTDDFFNLFNGISSECHCRYCISTAHLPDFCCTCGFQCIKSCRIDFSVFHGRSCSDDLFHTCGFSNRNSMTNRGNQWSRSSGNIAADAFHGGEFFSECYAGTGGKQMIFRLTCFGKNGNIFQSHLDCVHGFSINLSFCFSKLSFGHKKISRSELHSVKFLQKFTNCGIPFIADTVHNYRDIFFDFGGTKRAFVERTQNFRSVSIIDPDSFHISNLPIFCST